VTATKSIVAAGDTMRRHRAGAAGWRHALVEAHRDRCEQSGIYLTLRWRRAAEVSLQVTASLVTTDGAKAWPMLWTSALPRPAVKRSA
jgi:hypothetical protein